MDKDSNKWRNFIRVITILNAILWPLIVGWAKYITFKTIDNDKAVAVQSTSFSSGLNEIKQSMSNLEKNISNRLDRIENKIYYGRR